MKKIVFGLVFLVSIVGMVVAGNQCNFKPDGTFCTCGTDPYTGYYLSGTCQQYPYGDPNYGLSRCVCPAPTTGSN